MRVLRGLLTASLVATTLTIGNVAVVTSASAAETHSVCAANCDFNTIQAAVDAAAAGDTINVGPGLYDNFAISKPLTILGPSHLIAPRPGANRTKATVRGSVSIASEIDGVTLSGFSVIASNTSSVVGIDVGRDSKNVAITYNDISGFNQGIRSQGNSLEFGTNINVSYNYVHDLTPDAVYGSYSILLRNVKASNVSNNIVTDAVTGLSGQQLRRGILLRGAQDAVVANNVVNFGSTASAKASFGISVQQKLADGVNGDDLPISDVMIRGNTLSGSIWGVILSELDSQASDLVVEENTARNVFTGVIFRSYGQTGETVVEELLVQRNNFSAVEYSGALSAGVQVFSLDFFSPPSTNEFDGVVVAGNWLPNGNLNQLGVVNGLSVGAIQNPGPPLAPGTLTFHATTLDSLDARGNYWGASGPGTVGSAGGASITTSPFINSYRNDSTKAGQPGFWPIILKSAQTITFTPVKFHPAKDELELAASTSSGLSVGFTSNTTDVCTVSGITLTPVKAGTCAITAHQAGDSTYAAASMTRSIVLSRVPQTIAFEQASIGANTTTVLTATKGDGVAPVTFTEESAACSISEVSGVYTLTGVAAGTCVITASQAQDDIYSAASVKKSIAITKGAQATLTVTNSNASPIAKGLTGITLGVTGGTGSGIVTYIITGSGCTFSKTSGVLSVSTRTRGTIACSVVATRAGTAGNLAVKSEAKIFLFQ